MKPALSLALLATILPAPQMIAPTPAAAETERPPFDGRLMPPEAVASHVWVMRQPDRLWAAVIGNVTIIEQSDGVVLVDSGGSIADGREVVAAVRRLTPKPIKAVAITHWHNDHPLGIPAILAAFPKARVISTRATSESIKTKTKVGVGQADPALDEARQKRAAANITDLEAEAAKSQSPEIREQYAIETRWIALRMKRLIGNYAVPATEAVSDTLKLDDPVAPVELRFLGPANTDGDLIAWLPTQHVIVSGDIVVLPTPYGFSISTKPWLAALAALERLPFDTLIPGHGKVQHDRAYLKTLEWSMRDIAAKASAAAAAGLTKDQAIAAFDRAPQEARFGARDPWTRKWLNDYWLEGMFGTAFDEAKGIPAPGG